MEQPIPNDEQINREGWDFFDNMEAALQAERDREAADRDVLVAAYDKTFAGSHGQTVLRDLRRIIDGVPGFSPNLGFYNGAAYGYYRSGMNDLIRHIMRMTERSEQ